MEKIYARNNVRAGIGCLFYVQRKIQGEIMRGRKPKPTHLKLISGNPGKRPINEDEPVIEKASLDCPSWFTERQAGIWREAVESCPEGLITVVDVAVLTTWVVACALHREASERVEIDGLVVLSPEKQVPMQNPYLAILNRQALIMMKAASELGFTPSSRSRVSLKKSSDDTNPFKKMLNGEASA